MAITQTQTLPPKFVEDLGTDLAEQLVGQSGVPIVSSGVGSLTQQTGETAEQFAARQKAAEQFDIRKQNLSGLAPGVAGQDQLQKDAQALAQQGIGSYQPFLQAAQAASGPQAFQQYMSPYQQQVIDTTLNEFDRSQQIQEKKIRDSAIASGAFGGGREGVQLAEFGTGSARERALLQSGLLQQGFQQAQAARQQDIGNRGALATSQLGLGQFQQGLGQNQQTATGIDISRLGQLGSINQSQQQAQLQAQQENNRAQAMEPYERLGFYGSGVTGIMGGYPGQYNFSSTPSASPLQTALGLGTTFAGIYGGLKR